MLQFGHELRMPAEVQFRIKTVLEGSYLQLVESHSLTVQCRASVEACVRLSSPQRQGRPIRSDSTGAIDVDCLSSRFHKTLEPQDVEVVGRYVDTVGGPLSQDDVTKGPSYVRQVALHCSACRRRGIRIPNPVDEAIDANTGTGGLQEQRENELLLRTADLTGCSAVGDCQRSESQNRRFFRRPRWPPGAGHLPAQANHEPVPRSVKDVDAPPGFPGPRMRFIVPPRAYLSTICAL